MGHPVMQWQILARDPNKVSAFYTTLFGWKISADNPMGYRMVDTDSGRGINGGIWPIGDEGHPHVQMFIEVDDVTATAARVQELGGQIIIPPQVLPGGDELAVVLDTEGLSLGLMKTAR